MRSGFNSTILNLFFSQTRARGPVKRRPSTKKGREALRKSCIDLTFTMSPPEEDSENEVPKQDDAMKNQSFRNELQAKLLHPPKSVLKQAEYASIEKKPPLRNTMIRHYLKENHREDVVSVTDSGNSKQNHLSTNVPEIVVDNLNISHSCSINKEFESNEDATVTNHIEVKTERKREDTVTYMETSSGIFRKVELTNFNQNKQVDAAEDTTTYRSEITFRFGQKSNVESSNSASRRSFMNDLVTEQETSKKIKNVYESSLLKRMTFINEMIPKQSDFKDGSVENELQQIGRTNEQAGSSNKHSLLEPTYLEKDPKTKLVPDIFVKNEGQRSRNSSTSESNQNSKNGSNFLSFATENLIHSDVARRSSFIETDNFASPEFIKEDNLFDEDNEDVFSEKKLPPQSDILKRSTLVDDEDEELLVEAVPDKSQGICLI